MVNVSNAVRIERFDFGRLPSGEQVEGYLIQNDYIRCTVLNYGAVIQKLELSGADRSWTNVVLGFDDLDAYLQRSPHFGGVCGRHAGRIRNAQFSIDEQIFQLEKNFEGRHNLHGGSKGLDRRLWQVSPLADGLQLRYSSDDGENGFPGQVEFYLRYRLLGAELHHSYYATSDRPTPINLNNHTYFNLGDNPSTVSGQQLRIDASHYAPLSEEFLFTDRIEPVRNTPFDFREPALISARLQEQHPQLQQAGGFDHAFFLKPQNFWSIMLGDQASQRRLRIHTDQEVVVFYSGNKLSERINPLSEGRQTGLHGAVCLETQDLPAEFTRNPHKLTRPNHPYRAFTIWNFDCD